MGSREEIVSSARKVMSLQGYARTRISDIVKDAGVAQGTFYLHFKSKESILEELIKTIKQEQDILLSEITQANLNMTKKEFLNGLMAISSHFREFYSKNSDILKILTEEFPHSSLVRYHTDNFRKNARDIIAKFLGTGSELGILKEMNFDMIAEIISMSLKQFILMGSTKRLEYSVDDVFTTFIQLCMFGIIKNGGEKDA